MSEQNVAPHEFHQIPGLICPQCGFKMQVTIELLLNKPSICCSGCGLTLDIDQEKSKASLTALQKAYQHIKNVKNSLPQ
jgi:transcription elongation factor Elf1